MDYRTSPATTANTALLTCTDIRSSDVFVQMRNMNDEDLRLMAGFILTAPKVLGPQWGGGKIYF